MWAVWVAIGLAAAIGVIVTRQRRTPIGRARRALARTRRTPLGSWPRGVLACAEGRVEAIDVVHAPASGRACVYFWLRVEVHEEYASRTAFEEVGAVSFVVRDATGAITVPALGQLEAEVVAKPDFVIASHSFPFTETYGPAIKAYLAGRGTSLDGLRRPHEEHLTFHEAIIEHGQPVRLLGCGREDPDRAGLLRLTDGSGAPIVVETLAKPTPG